MAHAFSVLCRAFESDISESIVNSSPRQSTRGRGFTTLPDLTSMRAAGITLIACVFLVSSRLAAEDLSFFRDRVEAAGIGFLLNHSPTEKRYLIETMTGGCAFLDYDADGLLDIFLVNGAALREAADDHPSIDKSEPRFWNRLYRNVGKGRFEDVTAKARVQGKGYGLGVAVGDYDNDGYPDLYVTNYGRNEIYHNQGDGTFREVRRTAEGH